MRKSILINSVLAVVCVGLLGYIGWYVLEVPEKGSSAVEAAASLALSEQSANQIVAYLQDSDREWQVQSTQSIQGYEQRMAEAEELNAEMQRQRNNAKAEFLAQQIQRAQEQAELLQKLREEASQSVVSQGGTELNFSDVIHLGGTTEIPSGTNAGASTGKTGDVTVAPSGEQSVTVGGEVRADTYLGQVTATYVCTCEQCYNNTTCGEVAVGGNCVLTDGSAVPSAINVVFENGPVGTYHTELSSRVNGRNILILCGNHSVAGSGATIYPKVSNDHSVG